MEKDKDLYATEMEKDEVSPEKQREVERRLEKHGYTRQPVTPSSNDPKDVLAPDDTSPGTGPYKGQ